MHKLRGIMVHKQNESFPLLIICFFNKKHWQENKNPHIFTGTFKTHWFMQLQTWPNYSVKNRPLKSSAIDQLHKQV